MGAVYFYHMTQTPLEVTLPTLLGRSLAAGWDVLVRIPDEGRRARLDDLLWSDPVAGFLPHGRADSPDPDGHPVLLAEGEHPLAGRAAVISVDGAGIAPEDVTASQRAMILFDGTDPRAVEAARRQWRSLTGAGCAAQYWSQQDGPWAMKAQAGG